MRTFFPTDRQDWKGLSVPRCCPFLHWVWDCLGIGCTSTKISSQRIQWYHRSHQVSGFQSMMVRQHVWRGRVSCMACLQLWQLWIPTMEQSSGCCTSVRQTIRRHQRQILWNVFQHCLSEEVGTMSSSAFEPCSWGTPEDTGADHWGHEGVFTFSRAEVAFACELNSISVKKKSKQRGRAVCAPKVLQLDWRQILLVSPMCLCTSALYWGFF